MHGPDRGVVVYAFGIMPHAIRIDQVSSALSKNFQHAPINVVGHARNEMFGSRPQSLRPVFAHQLMIAANPSRRDNHRLRPQRECSYNCPRTRHATSDSTCFQYLSLDPIYHATAFRQGSNAMTKAQADQSSLFSLTHALHEWFENSGTRSPGHMKARNGVAMSGSERATALSPLHDREKANPLRMQPGVLLT